MQPSNLDRRGVSTALGYQFHIASSREQAIREAAPHYEPSDSGHSGLAAGTALHAPERTIRAGLRVGRSGLPVVTTMMPATPGLAGRRRKLPAPLSRAVRHLS